MKKRTSLSARKMTGPGSRSPIQLDALTRSHQLPFERIGK
jgi:hypothetical protein